MRLANSTDLDALWELETTCFEPHRQESRKAVARFLVHPDSETWVMADSGQVQAALCLRFHPKTVRIESLAVHPDCRGTGLGAALLEKALERARETGREWLSLEAECRTTQLITWYQRFGFRVRTELPDYYGPGHAAVRMKRPVSVTSRTAALRKSKT